MLEKALALAQSGMAVPVTAPPSIVSQSRSAVLPNPLPFNSGDISGFSMLLEAEISPIRQMASQISPSILLGEDDASYFDIDGTEYTRPYSNQTLSEISFPLLSPGARHWRLTNTSQVHYSPETTRPVGSPRSLSSAAKSFSIPTLTPSMVDYLLGLFFHRHQLLMKFISQRDFMAQKAIGEGPAFRYSLMLAMLAAGLRYSTRQQIKDICVGPKGENLLAEAAKKSLESELGRENMATVHAMIVLGEVETCAGNEMTAFMYCSMAAKLAFDLSLDLTSTTTTSLSIDQMEVRHWTFWVASVQDQYWSIVLKRPLIFKNDTLRMTRLVVQFAKNGSLDDENAPASAIEQQVTESVLDLMELVRDILYELYQTTRLHEPKETVSFVQKLDSQLDRWFEKLPLEMQRLPVGGEESYLLLCAIQMKFNSTKILIHQHLLFPDGTARIDPSTKPIPDPILAHSWAEMTLAATRNAILFETFLRRDDIRTLQTSGVQWATLSAQALTCHIKSLPVDQSMEAVLSLQSLCYTLQEMTKTFQTAIEVYNEACRNLEVFWQQLSNAGLQKEDPIFSKTLDALISQDISNISSISPGAQSVNLSQEESSTSSQQQREEAVDVSADFQP